MKKFWIIWLLNAAIFVGVWSEVYAGRTTVYGKGTYTPRYETPQQACTGEGAGAYYYSGGYHYCSNPGGFTIKQYYVCQDEHIPNGWPETWPIYDEGGVYQGCSEENPEEQCDKPVGSGTGYSTTGYYSMNGVVCGADYCEYNAQGGGYESSTNTSYAIAHSTGSTCPNPGEGTEGWEEYDPFTPDPPEEEIPEGCYKVHGEVMCPLEPVDNGDECGEVNGYEVCVQENGCTLVEGHEVCPDTPLNCVEGGGRRICIEGEPEEGPEPEGPADNCIVGSDGRVLCWSDEAEETTETTTEEVDNGDGTSTTTTTSTTTNNTYGGGSETTVTVDDGNGGITSTTTTQGTGEETFDGPDTGGVQSFEESALAFYSDVSGGPWGSAITDLGANFPEGGSCNTLEMSLYFGDISTDIHCVVWDTVKGGLEYGMIALWSILAILIVFSA